MEKKSWFKEHGDAVAIILSVFISVLSGVMWINGKFNDIEKDIAVMKTILQYKNIMKNQIAKYEDKEE